MVSNAGNKKQHKRERHNQAAGNLWHCSDDEYGYRRNQYRLEYGRCARMKLRPEIGDRRQIKITKTSQNHCQAGIPEEKENHDIGGYAVWKRGIEKFAKPDRLEIKHPHQLVQAERKQQEQEK